MNALGIGVIGCGEIAFTYHLPALARVTDARVVAVADLADDKARQAAHEFAIPAWTSDYREVLASSEIDAVLILTPNFTRVEMVQEAANAGKPMLVQKPLARNLSECQSVLAAAERQGVLLVPSYMHRYLPEVLKAKELLDQGLLGDLRMVRMRNATPGSSWTPWFYNKEKVGGGAAIDIGVHGIDLIRWLAGEITSVNALSTRMVEERIIRDAHVVPDNEDTVIATYCLRNGAVCVHEITWAEYAGYGRFEMELYGSDGSMLIRSGMGPLAVSSRHLAGEGKWWLPDLPKQFLGVEHHQDFVTAVSSGPTALTAIPEDGLRGIQIVTAIYESADSGKAVAL